ncbi:tetratricopeptide repeat protein [Trichloromonas sp.]|uniref:tetratricopeptide repeat protein n=1 Tax=Trichloromonas sp. TaxID=3069249 RepID=UPI003D819E81
MGLLNKIFGGGDPLSTLKRALSQQRWADVLREGECLDRESLPGHSLAELESGLELAGNRLAEINLAEGEACFRAGEEERAGEHFTLAGQYARATELKERAEQLLNDVRSSSGKVTTPASVASSCCTSGCQSSTPDETGDIGWDMETRLELALSSYPLEWMERYAGAGIEFKKALLMSHDGLLREALVAFEAVAESFRDDLYYFERGSLLVRMDDHRKGRKDLERAIELNPRHELAMETLVSLDLSARKLPAAESRLHSMLSSAIAPAFCCSRLAMISAAKGDEASAIRFGEQAIAAGAVDMETLVLQSSLLEKGGRLDEAERLLATLPGGGCGGGAHVLLAEFWLRQGKSLKKALESFKGTSRQDMENPRWPMRIAQTYLALGWRKDGQAMMKKVLLIPGLDDILRQEAEEILESLGK